MHISPLTIRYTGAITYTGTDVQISAIYAPVPNGRILYTSAVQRAARTSAAAAVKINFFTFRIQKNLPYTPYIIPPRRLCFGVLLRLFCLLMPKTAKEKAAHLKPPVSLSVFVLSRRLYLGFVRHSRHCSAANAVLPDRPALFGNRLFRRRHCF